MELFVELSLLIALATGMAVVMRLLHQPLIIGHILTGLIAGPLLFNVVQSEETLKLLGEIGVAMLLFTVGLHLSPDIIRKFGRVSVITGVGQVVFTSLAGYFLSLALGFEPLTAFYVAVALSFSSTIIILKLLADKGDLDVLYAKIAVGFLLVQDLIAVLLLLGLPLFSTGSVEPAAVVRFVLTGATLIGFVALASRFFISKASLFLSESREFLFLFAIAWGVGVAALFQTFGFSLESGALIAGVALASLPARHEISSRLMPLRDFFIVMFFILLGSQMHFADLSGFGSTVFILSALVLVGNPLILMALMGFLGYRRKTSLQTGFTVAQISEFSLILVAMGVSLGHVGDEVLSLVTVIGLITIFGSTYLVLYSDRIYKILAPYLSIFERRDAREPRMRHASPSVVLFGCNRLGYDFLEALRESGKEFLVVDYDPENVSLLEHKGVPVEFGDAGDFDFLDSLDFSRTELIVSTIPEAEVNSLIHNTVRQKNSDAAVLVVAHKVIDALSHYDEGVDYVILPHFLGGERAAELASKFHNDRSKYESLRKKHIERLLLRAAIGHEHPARSR